MGSKGKTTTGWRKRYFVNIRGYVWLLRGNGKKYNGRVFHQVHVDGRWVWLDTAKIAAEGMVVDNLTQLVALRLLGIPVRGEPRW
jgi:hypothetical protein